jgi:hypothetical protein
MTVVGFRATQQSDTYLCNAVLGLGCRMCQVRNERTRGMHTLGLVNTLHIWPEAPVILWACQAKSNVGLRSAHAPRMVQCGCVC